MEDITPCKHCGSRDIFRNVRACGGCTEHFYTQKDGSVETEFQTDNLYFTKPKTFYCIDCGRKRNDIKQV